MITPEEQDHIDIYKKFNDFSIDSENLRKDLAYSLWQTRREPGVSLEDIAEIINHELTPEEVEALIKCLKQ